MACTEKRKVFGEAFLRQHVRDILGFYDAVAVDSDAGGFHNQLLDDGSNYDAATKHVVGTCRFVVNYALAAELCDGEEAALHLSRCAHGLRFLFSRQRDADYGGFYWVVKAVPRLPDATPSAEMTAVAEGGTFTFEASDDSKCCYAAAFSLLALASARRAGLDTIELFAGTTAAAGGGGGADTVSVALDELIERVLAETDLHFFEAGTGLCADRFARNWSGADDGGLSATYRGQNPNMHMCEALLALSGLGGDGAPALLTRAATICRRLCHELQPGGGDDDVSRGGVVNGVWEHFSADWTIDWNFNKDADPASEEYIFRPYGLQPGHLFEWCKLILQLERALCLSPVAEAEPWMLPRARELFDLGVRYGWDEARGGACYTFDVRGEKLDQNKYYWVQAEMIAAAGLLAARTGELKYEDWYERAWRYCVGHFVDSERGGWFPMLSAANERLDPHLPMERRGQGGPAVKSYPSKTDYHPLAACYEVLMAQRARTTQTLVDTPPRKD